MAIERVFWGLRDSSESRRFFFGVERFVLELRDLLSSFQIFFLAIYPLVQHNVLTWHWTTEQSLHLARLILVDGGGELIYDVLEQNIFRCSRGEVRPRYW